MRADAECYRVEGRTVEFVSIPGWGHQWSPAHNSRIWSFLSQHSLVGDRSRLLDAN
ncbi:MAG TPA: hypothetical protein VMV10_31225 [Pirellulales bacterium]|nr:hypothetical protein [Pirellulales bacterium]